MSEVQKESNLLNEKFQSLSDNFILSDLISLYLYDKKKQQLVLKFSYDREEDKFQNISNGDVFLLMIEPKGCIGKVFLTKSAEIYNYITSDKEYFQSYDNELNHKLKSQLIYPIMENNELLGMLRLSLTINSKLKKYTLKEMAEVNVIAPYLVNLLKQIISNSDTEPVHDSVDNTPLLENETIPAKEEKIINDENLLLFLSNTVHDIRTPANSLYGFLELLEEQIEDRRLKGFVSNAKESASFINTLTDSILETAKNRYKATYIEKEVISSIVFFSSIGNTFSAKMSGKKIDYFIFIDPSIPKEIKVDKFKLKRILVNLIGNAYKFTPVEHQIDFKVLWDKSNQKVMISVKDTGIGIEKEDQEKLFKSFSQVGKNTADKYGGSGLGLAISASYVSDMDSELKLKSKLDEGSEFYFDIPVEVVNSSTSYKAFHNVEKKILILTDYPEANYPKFIEHYLVKLGMPKEKIIISNTLEHNVTHVICFEEKITPSVLNGQKLKLYKLLLIENKLFSLLDKSEFKVTSKNIYNADALYSIVFSGKKLKVLIVDDNKLNLTLLESMLASEFLDIYTSLDGEEALMDLKKSAKKGDRFDIVYLDKHMNSMSGTQLLEQYRRFETKYMLKPIYAVSITGDPHLSQNEHRLYDAIIAKPFNKHDVQEVISKFKNN